MTTWRRIVCGAAISLGMAVPLTSVAAPARPYVVVDTAQDRCYDNAFEIPYPQPGEAFFGQDAQFRGPAPDYQDNGDGTVTDRNTGLMWMKTPAQGKRSFSEARSGARTCHIGGYTDWRLPTIKELYSLILFNGVDVAPGSRWAARPFIDTQVFGFAYGDPQAGERIIDAQYWSATEYVATTMGGQPTVFGVNFADGRIKGYPRDRGRQGRTAQHFVRYVRGNTAYGHNDYMDNGDGTITDRATGLTWQKGDSGRGMNWHDALAYAEQLDLAGYTDWRLPNAKELQSIVDYRRSPAATIAAARGPAIDPIFQNTATEAWYWTGTTHQSVRGGDSAVYLCFGQAFGHLGPPGRKRRVDVHGAGAQRSDPKAGDPAFWPAGRGPQGDEIRINNYVRCVRGGGVTPIR